MTLFLLTMLLLGGHSALAAEPDPAPIFDLDDEEDPEPLFDSPDSPLGSAVDLTTPTEPLRTVVAIVPLDGVPGTSFRDLEVVVRGLAEVMSKEPELAIVSGSELVNRLTEGNQRALLEARDAMTEGMILLTEGDPDIGIAFLEEAVAAHDRAGSAVARREEMADSAFALAKAWHDTGKRDEAATVLELALRLVPDYLDVNPDGVDPALRELAREVEASLFDRPPRRLSRTGAQKLGDTLQADRLIHGLVQPGGDLSLTIYDPQGDEIATTVRPGPFAAPRLGDPRYQEMARPLINAALGIATPPPLPPPSEKDPKPKKRGTKVALGITMGAVAAGAVAAGYLIHQSQLPDKPAWDLQVRLVR